MKILDNVVRANGKWGDVVVSPGGRVVWFYSVDGAVVCEVDGMQAWRTLVPTDFLRYTRGTAVPELAAIGQSSDDAGFIVTHSGPQHQGFAPGQNAVAFGPDGLPYIMRSGRSYSKGTEIVHVPLTSQGIRDVLPDGAVVMGDDANHTFIKGHEFWQYQKRGDITVGQAGTDIGLAVLYKNDYFVISRQGDPQGVHFADLNDGRIAVCAWTVHGAELWMIDLFAPSEPKPTPKPEPKPEPTPEPKPMPTAPNALPIIRGVLADPRFFHINPAEDGERGQITDEVVRRLGGVPWGRKDRDKNPDNQNNSDDALCYRLADGRFEIYDILVGLPTGSPRESFAAFAYAGTFTDGENGYFREVPQAGPGPSPTPGPTPGPGPAPDALAAILKRLDVLEGPRHVSIKSSRDRYMRDEWTDNTARFDRDAVGSGEQFTIEPIK